MLVVFGLTLAAVMQTPGWEPAVRDLDALELFAGVGAIMKAAHCSSFSAEAFEIHRIPGISDSRQHPRSEDLTCEAGFRNAVCNLAELQIYCSLSIESFWNNLGPYMSSRKFKNWVVHKNSD